MRETADADIVTDRSPANLQRLVAAMRELNARLRVAGLSDYEARRLPVQVDAHTLGQLEVSTWMTDAGGFDVLNGLQDELGRVVAYEELAQRATRLRVGERVIMRVAALDDIITAKERADRPKDREALPELRALRAQIPVRRSTDVKGKLHGAGPGPSEASGIVVHGPQQDQAPRRGPEAGLG